MEARDDAVPRLVVGRSGRVRRGDSLAARGVGVAARGVGDAAASSERRCCGGVVGVGRVRPDTEV